MNSVLQSLYVYLLRPHDGGSTPLVEAPLNDHGNISGLRKSVPSAIYSTHVVDAQ